MAYKVNNYKQSPGYVLRERSRAYQYQQELEKLRIRTQREFEQMRRQNDLGLYLLLAIVVMGTITAGIHLGG